MTELEIIRAEAEAATEGPWEVGTYRPYSDVVQRTGSDDNDAFPGQRLICVVGQINPKNNNIFIAHSRTTVPRLCDMVKCRDEALEVAMSQVESFYETCIEIDGEFYNKFKARIDKILEGK